MQFFLVLLITPIAVLIVDRLFYGGDFTESALDVLHITRPDRVALRRRRR